MTDTPPPREQFLDSRGMVVTGGIVIAALVLACAWLLRVVPALDAAAWDRVASALADTPAPRQLLVVRAAPRTGDAQIAEAVLRLDSLGARSVALALDLSAPIAPTGAMATLPARVPATRFAATISGDSVGWPWFLGDAERAALRADGRLAVSTLVRDADGVVRRSLSRDGGTPTFAARAAAVMQGTTSTTSDSVRLLRFAATGAGWHGLRTLPLTDLLQPRSDSLAATIRGATVLLGIDDGALVPTSVGPLPALAILGHDIAARARVQSGATRSIAESTPGHAMLWLLPWLVCGALLVIATSWRVTLGVGILGVVVQAVLAIVMVDGYGVWLPLGSAILTWVTAIGGASAIGAWQVRRAQRFTSQLFSRFMTAALADAAWRSRHLYLDGGRPAPLLLPVTVLFLDLRGFTRFSEQATPAAVMELLTAVTSACAADIAAHGGLVDDFAGDGIKADFGVPVPRTTPELIAHDARQAVACAVTLAQTVQWLLPNTLGTGGTQVRIGVHSGMAVAGTIGGASRLKYTVAGDVVNVAARLQSIDLPSDADAPSPCRILVSHETLQLLSGDAPRVTDEGAVTLKGREHPVYTHRVYLPPLNAQPIPTRAESLPSRS